jgi:hypothetical protein
MQLVTIHNRVQDSPNTDVSLCLFHHVMHSLRLYLSSLAMFCVEQAYLVVGRRSVRTIGVEDELALSRSSLSPSPLLHRVRVSLQLCFSSTMPLPTRLFVSRVHSTVVHVSRCKPRQFVLAQHSHYRDAHTSRIQSACTCQLLLQGRSP